MSTAAKSLVAFVLLTFTASVALAEVKWTDFTADAFAEAQAAGKLIVVDIHADWCPTCRAQQPILNELRAEAALKDAVFIKVDFDREKDFLRTHRIPRQSTILVFKGDKEIARSIAETDRDRLRAMVLGAIDG